MRRLCITMAALAAPAIAMASSDDAWEAFRAEVDGACRELIEAPDNAQVAVEVNPFGSESYGAALVRVIIDGAEDRMICIFDKQSKDAELTGAFLPVTDYAIGSDTATAPEAPAGQAPAEAPTGN